MTGALLSPRVAANGKEIEVTTEYWIPSIAIVSRQVRVAKSFAHSLGHRKIVDLNLP